MNIVNVLFDYRGLFMKAVILADGEGKNLKPLTCTEAESTLPVFGKPLIFYLLDKLLSTDIIDVILILNYKSTDIISLFPNNSYDKLNIQFVIEENDYGSAGSVKNALPEPDDTVLLINGNIYFEENIRNIYDFHKSKNNDFTLFISSDTNETGEICLLEPCVIEKIPYNEYFEINDLIREVSNCNINLDYFHSERYSIKIKEISDYKKLLFDILDRKTEFTIPFSADGVYSFKDVPSGDYMIIPPVFFGENIQIENGAVIGPYTVISDGCLISKGSKVGYSVLLKNIYISSGCSVNGSLICEGASVKHGASIFENTVIGADSVIGEEAVINPNILVWPKKTVGNGENVSDNIKYSPVLYNSFNISSVISGDFGIELTPEKTAKLGAALGTLFENIRIGIGIDGENNSLALKCGMLGGLISTGAKSFDFGKCFNSQLFYYSSFCDIDITVFINGGNEGAVIYLYEKGGIPFSTDLLRKLETIMKHNEFNRCSGCDCRSVSVMSSMEQMYINEVIRQFESDKCNFELSVISSEKQIVDCACECLNKIGSNTDGEDYIFKINNLCTRLNVIEKNISFNHEKILAVVSYNEMLKGYDIALPWDAPQIITSLADSTGRKVYRYSEENSSKYYLNIHTEKQLWSRDALFLMFKILSLMVEKNCSISELIDELPDFYIVKKVIETDKPFSNISKKLIDNGFCEDENNENILLKNNSNVKIKKGDNGKSLRIIAEAVSVEAAEEICAEINKMLNDETIDNNV